MRNLVPNRNLPYLVLLPVLVAGTYKFLKKILENPADLLQSTVLKSDFKYGNFFANFKARIEGTSLTQHDWNGHQIVALDEGFPSVYGSGGLGGRRFPRFRD